MRGVIILSVLLFSLTGWSQSDAEKTHRASGTISNETADLRFLLRTLPDNGWFLELHKDSTYEYTHWSGFGVPEETVLERGTYSITENRIILSSEKKESELAAKTFFLVTVDSDEAGNNSYIDCVVYDSQTYCLLQKP